MLGEMRGLLRTLTSTVFIFAALGFVLAHYGSGSGSSAPSPPPLSRQAAAQSFSVRYPASWHVLSAGAVARLPLNGTVALGPGPATDAEQLAIGAVSPPRTPGQLPAPLQPLVGTAQPQTVTLGRATFYRYLNLRPPGQSATESIYLLPTTLQTITAVCSATRPSAAFTSSCERVLATIRVTQGRELSLTPDAGYALELNRILGRLDTTRAAAARDLRSSDPKKVAAAAGRLASADTQAASDAHRITGVTVSVANMPLESALKLNAGAYRSLAEAALRHDAGGYQRAQAAVTRSIRALNAVYAQLRSLGYRIG